MRVLPVFLALAVGWSSASAATKAERCEKYKEQLRRIDAAKRGTSDKARLHKLESRRQKVLAGQARNKC